MQEHRFNSLDQALEVLQAARAAASVEIAGPITLHQTLIHLAQSIECSMRGYPQLKPSWMRATVGPMVAGIFFMRGRMKHNLAAPVPGEPSIDADGDLQKAWERLLSAIATFKSWNGVPQPHFMFGKLSKAEYDRLHAMHIADHFSQVTAHA